MVLQLDIKNKEENIKDAKVKNNGNYWNIYQTELKRSKEDYPKVEDGIMEKIKKIHYK